MHVYEDKSSVVSSRQGDNVESSFEKNNHYTNDNSVADNDSAPQESPLDPSFQKSPLDLSIQSRYLSDSNTLTVNQKTPSEQTDAPRERIVLLTSVDTTDGGPNSFSNQSQDTVYFDNSIQNIKPEKSKEKVVEKF